MKFNIVIATLIVALTAATAWAQLDPGPDGIGIYTDLEGLSNSLVADEGVITLYVLATGISDPDGIQGWEFGLRFDGALEYIGFAIPYPCWSVVYYPTFAAIATTAPLDNAPVIHLVTLYFTVTGSEPGNIYVEHGYAPPGGSGGTYMPVYYSDADHVHILYPSSGGIELPVFRLNAEAPVATESMAWSHVKALYR